MQGDVDVYINPAVAGRSYNSALAKSGAGLRRGRHVVYRRCSSGKTSRPTLGLC